MASQSRREIRTPPGHPNPLSPEPVWPGGFHWLLHYGPMLRRFGYLPSCWCLERKHRAIKRFLDASKATVSDVYDRNILRDMTARSLTELEGGDSCPFGLVNPKIAKEAVVKEVERTLGPISGLKTARVARGNNHQTFCIEDVSLINTGTYVSAAAAQLHDPILSAGLLVNFLEVEPYAVRGHRRPKPTPGARSLRVNVCRHHRPDRHLQDASESEKRILEGSLPRSRGLRRCHLGAPVGSHKLEPEFGMGPAYPMTHVPAGREGWSWGAHG